MFGTFRRTTAAVVTATVFGLGLWIRLTPWNSATHLLSVGAPELAPVFLLLLVVALALIAVDLPHSRPARAIAALAVLAAVLPLTVVGTIPGTLRAADAAMTAAFGPAPRGTSDAPKPAIAWLPLVAGLPHSNVTVIPDVPLTGTADAGLTVTIYRGPQREPGRAIVQIYGGGWRSGAPGDNAPNARALAARGDTVFAIDYRHSPTYRWPTQLADVQAARDWIAAHAREYGADASRQVFIGRSSGAQLALISAITSPSPDIRGVVLVYSPVDLTSGYRDPPVPDILGLQALEAAFIGGTPDDRPDAYRDASPITHADKPHPPVLMFTAGRDVIVKRAFGEALYARLRQSGTAALINIPWSGHGFDFVAFGPGGQLATHYTAWFIDAVTAPGR